ncbi:MAG: permease [Planctomycetota bacterium]
MKDRGHLIILGSIFAALFFIPFDSSLVSGALLESVRMLQEYVREHVLLCLIPAFFIAGAIANFISGGSVIRYLGAGANKFISYAVASVSGAVLAVCSCTVLPLFAGIYKKGAGIGPAVTFLYSGPAINVLAFILTTRILGFQLGAARAVGAVCFSIIIGLLMSLFFLKEEKDSHRIIELVMPDEGDSARPLWKTGIYFFSMIAIIVFVNWGRDDSMFVWSIVYRSRYIITGIFLVLLLYIVLSWFRKEELKEWVYSTWGFAKQILPLLFAGVLAAGFLLGRPGHEGVVSAEWVAKLVGGNKLSSNLFASVLGAFMYFATLTEVPILQGLLGSGMGKGPALALLLSGPALSLPNMLVIRSVIGSKKTVAYIILVVVMSAAGGKLFGFLF